MSFFFFHNYYTFRITKYWYISIMSCKYNLSLFFPFFNQLLFIEFLQKRSVGM